MVKGSTRSADTQSMSARTISLRYSATCHVCKRSLAANTKASYNGESRAITCLSCVYGPPNARRPFVGKTVNRQQILTGVAGTGPQREHDRRAAIRDKEIRHKWGRLAPMAKFLSEEPQHIAAFGTGAEGERLLAKQLERDVRNGTIFLHSRKISHGDIDHLAIAPSGIYVIDAKKYDGRVEGRDVGNWLTTDRRLYVKNRDRSNLVEGMEKQVDAVTRALALYGLDGMAIRPILCFVKSEWGTFRRPISFGTVTCLWPGKLCELLKQPGPLDSVQREQMARRLSIELPAAA